MVEGARIDHAHHDGLANRALEETVAFDQALSGVIKSLKDSNQLDEVKVLWNGCRMCKSSCRIGCVMVTGTLN